MVVGHNPTMQMLVLRLIGANGNRAGQPRCRIDGDSRRAPAEVPHRRARDA